MLIEVSCKGEEDLINLLLLHCEWTWRLWAVAYRIMGINRVLVAKVQRELSAWCGICNVGKRRRFARLIPFLFFGLFGRKGIGELLKELVT